MKPRIVISREQRPWRRPLMIALVAGVLAVAGWGLYSYTRTATVVDFRRAKLEVEELREERRRLARELRASKEEVAQLREQVVYAQRSAEIDVQACKEVRESLQEYQAQTAELREQLAFYRGIVSPEQARAGVRVQELKFVRLEAARSYRYNLVLIQAVRHDRRVQGRIQVELIGQARGAERRYALADLAPGEAGNLVFSLKYFEEFSGTVQLPQDFVPSRVQVTLVPGSGGTPKIEEFFDWARVTNEGGA